MGVLPTTRRTISPRSTGPISTGYAPGSTWKLVTATAMLRYGLRTPATYYDDRGSYTIGGHSSTTTTTRHSATSTCQALSPSPATPTSTASAASSMQEYDAGRQLKAPDPLQSVASQYGLGHYSGIALPAEAPGLVPDAAGRRQGARPVPQGLPRRRTGSRATRCRRQSARARTRSPRCSSTMPTPPSPMAAPCTCPRWPWPWRRPGTGSRPNGRILELLLPAGQGPRHDAFQL